MRRLRSGKEVGGGDQGVGWALEGRCAKGKGELLGEGVSEG